MIEALDFDENGAKWLPFAQHKLRALKVFLDGCGLAFGRKNYITPDGEGRIYIRTRRGHSLIEKITAQQGRHVNVPPSIYAPDDWVDEWYDYIRIETCKDRQGFLLYRDYAFATAPYSAYYVDGVVERIHPWDGTPSPDPTIPVTFRTVGYKVPDDLTNETFETRNTASRYSGLMRAVVGCYHSGGKDAPFSYSWAKTHGIVKFAMSIGDPADRYWIVEVSASGVYAAPIRYTGECCGSWGVVKYMPTADQLAENPSLAQYKTTLSLAWAFAGRPDSGVTQLLAASDMVTAYARSPFFGGHGWAFNYSGTEAQAVTQEFLLTPAKHYNCSRFKLSFSFSQEADGGLLSCVIATVEADLPASFSGGQVWVPTGPATWDGTRVADATSITTYPNQNAPIHVYYAGDMEIVTRFTLAKYTDVTYDYTPAYQSEEGPIGWDPQFTINWNYGYYNFSKENVGPFDTGTYQGIITLYAWKDLGVTHKYTYNPGVVAGFVSPLFSAIHDARFHTLIDDTMEDTTTEVIETDTRTFVNGCWRDYHVAYTNTGVLVTRVTRTGSVSGRSSVVLFMGEREAVLNVKDNQYADSVHTQQGIEFVAATSNTNRTTVITPNPGDTCGTVGYTTAIGLFGWPMVFHAPLQEGGTASDNSYTASTALAIGSYADVGSIDSIDMSTFLRTGIVGGVQTAMSAAFAMHGNLYAPDDTLTPADQKANRAVWLDSSGVTVFGGFAPLPANDPYAVIAFVGKA